MAEMRALVVADYRTRYHDPIRFDAGEIVHLGERDHEWPAYVWTRLADDRAGWAPCDLLRPLDAERAETLSSYDARELDVSVGQSLRLHDELGGWWWAQREDGAGLGARAPSASHPGRCVVTPRPNSLFQRRTPL